MRSRDRQARRVPRVLGVAVLLAAVVTASAPGWTSYRVRQGDTLSEIAARYRTTTAQLAAVNGLPGNGNVVYAGTVIKVPTAGTRAARPAARRVFRAANGARYVRSAVAVRVRPGESLGVLAKRYGTTVGAIKRGNRISGSRIYPGQRLLVPVRVRLATSAARRPAVAPASRRVFRAANGVRYARSAAAIRVRRGDSLGVLAKRYRTTVGAIKRANRISGSRIYPGQRLLVPVRVRLGAAPARRPAATAANTFAGRTYPNHVVRAAARNRAILARRHHPTRAQTRAMIRSTAQAFGVDPSLALAIAYQESGFNQRRVSVANAIGVMQVIPSTGTYVSGVVGRRLDLLNARDNIIAGVVLLRILTQAAPRSQAVAGYYQGLGSVRRNGMYADTVVYVRNVLRLRTRFA